MEDNHFNGPIPKLSEMFYVLIRTKLTDGQFDPQFYAYDIHPLPLGADLDTATEMAYALADEDASWQVYIGQWKAVEGMDGVAKLMHVQEPKQ